MEIILKDNDCVSGGIFDKNAALRKTGRKGGICYSNTDFEKLDNEPAERQEKRANANISRGHHSVAGHVSIDLEIVGIPKIMAMLLNNEHDYNTSERSFRYTSIVTSGISQLEIEKYEKWCDILSSRIYDYYSEFYTEYALDGMEGKIAKLAKENARYMVNVMVPTSMAYKTTWRQFNYLVNYMKQEIEFPSNEIFAALIPDMEEFVRKAYEMNLVHDGLLDDKKGRHFSLFDDTISGEFFEVSPHDGRVYNTNYYASFAYLAQAHRHRSLNFGMKSKLAKSGDERFYIPPIIEDDPLLVIEWLEDMAEVYVLGIHPQGELVLINENGTLDNFLNSKCKERLCSAAQLEIARKTGEQFELYRDELLKMNSPLSAKFDGKKQPLRCTFDDYECLDKCNMSFALRLERKI